MELKEYINIIKKRLLLIIVITLLSIFTSAIFSYLVIKPVYKADISVIIGRTGSEGKTNTSEILMYQKLVKTYAQFATSRRVAEDVIQKLDLKMSTGQLISMISVAPKGDTEFLTITVRSGNPEQSMNIANQLAKSLQVVSKEVRGEDIVYRLDEALLPTRPDSPKPVLNMAIAFFMGVMVSVGIVFLIEYLDNTVKTQEEVEKLLGVPVIGTIPLVEGDE
jgi:capsular polysaccharide biosynthesis protein